MWTRFSVSLIVLVFSVGSVKLPLPSYLKACDQNKPDFDECALKQANLGLPTILKGDRKYGIPNFSPLHVDQINLKTAGNLVINLKDVRIHGLDKASVTRVQIVPSKKHFYLDFKVDQMDILGKYEMDGKLLVLPLKGKGDANITAVGGEFQYDFSYGIKKRDGEDYLNVEKQNIDFTLTKLHLHFDNLFNGDPILGGNTNKVINEEWKAVLQEIKPAIGDAIATIAGSIIHGVTDRVPIEFILPTKKH